MTSEQIARSVSIARDVLKHLNAFNLPDDSYCFLEPRLGASDWRDNMGGEDLGSHLDTAREVCTVCALGACYLSLLETTVTSRWLTEAEAKWGIHFEDLAPELIRAMGVRNMTLVETAYEAGDGWHTTYMDVDHGNVTPDEFRDAVAFADNYPDRRARLKAIMTNIIDNCGVFQPGEVTIAA